MNQFKKWTSYCHKPIQEEEVWESNDPVVRFVHFFFDKDHWSRVVWVQAKHIEQIKTYKHGI